MSAAAVETSTPAAVPRSVVGIIHPPPEVRNIVDKTADFVSRIGPEFEAKIRQTEANNPKFNFLHANDPYHAYYRFKIRDYTEQRASGATPSSGDAARKLAIPTSGAVKDETATATKQKDLSAKESIVPREPPTDFEFIYDPPSINALDLDIVKITAQFVARNGRQFLTQLMNKEARNYQFDFLRPQHSLFTYFTKLVEQYTKILIPPKDILGKLNKDVESPTDILKQVNHRVDWAKYQERQRRREEEAAEKERMSYALIDWHDFVVVETVDYQQGEPGNFPPPTKPEEVGARVLARERGDEATNQGEEAQDEYEEVMEEEMQLEKEALERQRQQQHQLAKKAVAEDDSMQIDDEEEEPEKADHGAGHFTAPPPPPPPPPVTAAPAIPLPPTMLDNVLIRRDYDPKAHRAAQAEETSAARVQLISPFTGERLDPSNAQKHVRVGLLDPKWIEQRDREIQLKRDEEMVYAPGNLIESSLKKLAERRTDIFGLGVDETEIGKRLDQEDEDVIDANKSEKLIWDGHSRSMPVLEKRALDAVTPEERAAELAKRRQEEMEREKIGPQVTLGGAPVIPVVRAPVPQPQPTLVPQPVRPMVVMQPPSAGAPPPLGAPLHPLAAPRPPMMLQMNPGGPAPAGFLNLAPGGVRPPVLTGMVAPQLVLAGQTLMPPAASMGPPLMAPATMDGPPAAKKPRTQEELLIPEEQFLRDRGGLNATTTFQVVNMAAPQPQPIEVSMKLGDTVAALKTRLSDMSGMPASKQKLQIQTMFLKDNNSLAYYNVGPGVVVQLLAKERGGRKK